MNQKNASQTLQQHIISPCSGVRNPTEIALLPTPTSLERPVSEEKPVKNTILEKFPFRETYINHRLPPYVGVLYVFESGQENYRTLGFNAESEDILQTAAQKCPCLALGEMVTTHTVPEMETPEIIRDLMTEFSHHQLDIRNWVKGLKKRFGENLLLVIVDYTDAEIPWEMLEISSGKYLGAEITTARWQHIIGEDNHIFLEISPYECQGKVLAYLNRTELKGTQQEAASLQAINSISYNEILKFRKHLRQAERGFGLVYMACHGIYDDDARHLALGTKTDERQKLTLMNLRRDALNLLKESPSVVFINACHSGRLHQDDYRICARDRIGFAELFLGKGSRAVIGTLGGVADKYAARMGQRLLEEVTKSPDVPLATILKNIRAYVANKITDDSTNEDLLEFIYTFMYVYYGNPLLRLRLVSCEERKNASR